MGFVHTQDNRQVSTGCRALFLVIEMMSVSSRWVGEQREMVGAMRGPCHWQKLCILGCWMLGATDPPGWAAQSVLKEMMVRPQ